MAKPLTALERIQSLEKRLQAVEAVLIEFRRTNAHLHVGGTNFAEEDIKRIEAARREGL